MLHMLDVAACAELLIEAHSAFRGLSDAQRRALVVLVALHDVGKLSKSFRALVRCGETGAPRHWQLSDFLLCGPLDETLGRLGANEWVRAELYAAVAGHHGQPPMRAGGIRSERRKRQRAIGSGEGGSPAVDFNIARALPGCITGGHECRWCQIAQLGSKRPDSGRRLGGFQRGLVSGRSGLRRACAGARSITMPGPPSIGEGRTCSTGGVPRRRGCRSC